MQTAVVTKNYNFALPEQVINKFNIKVGQKFQIIEYKDRLEFIPFRPIKDMRGFLKGIDTTIIREEDRL